MAGVVGQHRAAVDQEVVSAGVEVPSEVVRVDSGQSLGRVPLVSHASQVGGRLGASVTIWWEG